MKRILFFGDSNTFGYDPRGFFGGRYGEEIRWVDRLAREFKGEIEVIGRGMNGRTVPETARELENLDAVIRALSPLDYLAIMLGTNDLVLVEDPDYEKAGEAMRRLLKHLLGREPFISEEGEVILVAPPPMFPDEEEGSPWYRYRESGEKLTLEYSRIAEDLGLRFIDASSWDLAMASDGVHLTEEGSVQFGEAMKEELKKLMGMGEGEVCDEGN